MAEIVYLAQEDDVAGSFVLQENGSKIILDSITVAAGFNALPCTKANILSQAGAIPGGSAPPVTTVSYTCLTWVASNNGASFAYYELGRVGRNGGSIARITNEAITYFADFECPRNIPLQYQIRTVLTSGVASSWANFPVVTIPVADCVLTFANNAAPLQAFACQDVSPYDFAFSNEDDVRIVKIAGRNVPMGFRGTERGGDVFSRTIYIAGLGANRSNAYHGRGLLQPVLNLIRNARVPYVALADAAGWNWLTTPKITNARISEPGGVYTATIAFTETSDESSPFETAAPWRAT